MPHAALFAAPDRAFCASAAATLRRRDPPGCAICGQRVYPGSQAVPCHAFGDEFACDECAHHCANCSAQTITSVLKSGGLCGECDAALDDVLAATGAGAEVLAS